MNKIIMKSRKDAIKKIEEIYGRNISDISTDIGCGRGVVYFWMSQTLTKKNPLTEKLKAKYPKVFEGIEGIKVDKAKKTKVEKVKKEVFQAMDKDKPSVEPTQPKLPMDLGAPDAPKDKKPVILKNLKCANECYFMKVLAIDYARSKPKCPICGTIMLAKEDRPKDEAEK